MDIFEKRGIASKVVGQLKSDSELFSVVEKVLEKADMNTNTLKNLIRYLREIKLRDDCGYDGVLKNARFAELVDNTELSERSKGEEIISRLYNLRFPLWSAKQADFKKLTNRFRALTGGEVIFPEFAEGNSFTVSFKIKNESDIEKILETFSTGKGLLSESLKKIRE